VNVTFAILLPKKVSQYNEAVFVMQDKYLRITAQNNIAAKNVPEFEKAAAGRSATRYPPASGGKSGGGVMGPVLGPFSLTGVIPGKGCPDPGDASGIQGVALKRFLWQFFKVI
jgi:hypothetical protein